MKRIVLFICIVSIIGTARAGDIRSRIRQRMAKIKAAALQKAEGKTRQFFSPLRFRTVKDNEVYGLAMALHQARFYLKATPLLRVDDKLAIYRLKEQNTPAPTDIVIKDKRYVPVFIGRAAIIKKQRNGTLEADVRSADCFDPMRGWSRELRPGRRGVTYILSKENYTGLAKDKFELLMTGNYWTGMSQELFSAIATDPTTTETSVTEDGQKTEEWTFEMPGKKWHYLFFEGVLRSYIE